MPCLLQLLTEEFYRLQTSSEKRSSELRAQNAEQASRLETYEHLEQELDQVTIQAAESKNTLHFSHYSAEEPQKTSESEHACD